MQYGASSTHSPTDAAPRRVPAPRGRQAGRCAGRNGMRAFVALAGSSKATIIPAWRRGDCGCVANLSTSRIFERYAVAASTPPVRRCPASPAPRRRPAGAGVACDADARSRASSRRHVESCVASTAATAGTAVRPVAGTQVPASPRCLAGEHRRAAKADRFVCDHENSWVANCRTR